MLCCLTPEVEGKGKSTRSALLALGNSVTASAEILAKAFAPPTPERPKIPAYKKRLMELIGKADLSGKKILRKALYCKDPEYQEIISCYIENEQENAMSYDDLLLEIDTMPL